MRTDRGEVLTRLREDSDFAQSLGCHLRDLIEGGWGPDTAHPDYAPGFSPGNPVGQCYVTSLVAAHRLRTELGLDAKIALGSLWSDKGRTLQIAYHGWVVVGDPLNDPLVFDLTADQALGLPRFLAGTATSLATRYELSHQYQEVADLEGFVDLPDSMSESDSGHSVKGRWLALDMRIRAEGLEDMEDFRSMAGLDLSKVTDSDVAIELDHVLQNLDDPTGRLIVRACRKIAENYSFAATRTYPRPDHPDPRKRRSLAFLLTGILVSLRTTLENEQRAMDAVLDACARDLDLFEIPEQDLAKLIRPAGMPDKKARTIKNALDYCRAEFGDDFSELLSFSEEQQRVAVENIPGFGPKSRDCFLSIGLGVSAAVVDVNVFRAYSHLTGDSQLDDFSDPQQVELVRVAIDESLPREPFLRQITHTLLLLFGKNRFGLDGDGVCVVGSDCRSCAAAASQRLFST